jgi:P-aminobenzoate N-oxygenase AurF
MKVPTVPPREVTADRLLASSLRHQYDPLVEIDWAAPLDPDRFWLPEHRSTLYGTALWDGLTPRQRVELTKHEVASIASAGIWFETILMQLLIRDFFRQDPTSRHAQYALTEVADECRHSIMFARLIERVGAPYYPAGRFDQALSTFLAATASGVHMYAAALIAEEVLDTLQRELIADESLNPLIRMVSRIHVVEEARHVRYAREEIVRQVADAGRAGMAYSRLITGRAALLISRRLIDPRVYASVGIDPATGWAAARANPGFRETMRVAAERIVTFLDDLGLIGGPGAALWRRSLFLAG